MSIPTTYLNTAKNLDAILDAIQKAGIPDKFTNSHLKSLGFASSGDRSVIGVLKALDFLDSSGRPTDHYSELKDPSRRKVVMAQRIRSAYADIYALNEQAHTLGATELVGMFGRVSGKSEAVAKKMATTFLAFAKHADFRSSSAADDVREVVDVADATEPGEANDVGSAPSNPGNLGLSLRHDIHIHLPSTTEVKVYDAIFQSIQRHLVVS